MSKCKFEFYSWGVPPDISGGFHIGPFFDWEPWSITIGFDLGFWGIRLEFDIPFTEEREKRLLHRCEQEARENRLLLLRG